MNIRNSAIAILAAAALGGCVTGYGYRAGAGDYYYGQPSGDYYGYGSMYGGYGYDGYGYGGYGYGGYGYGYPYYGYGYPYFGYYYPGYPYYPVRPPHRPPHHPVDPRPGKPGYVIPDDGVRYQSRGAQRALGGTRSMGVPDQVQSTAEPRYLPRYRQGMPQGQPRVDAGSGRRLQVQPQPMPPRSQPIAPRPEPRSAPPQPDFQSRPAPARQSAPPRSSFRDRDHRREQTP